MGTSFLSRREGYKLFYLQNAFGTMQRMDRKMDRRETKWKMQNARVSLATDKNFVRDENIFITLLQRRRRQRRDLAVILEILLEYD